MGHRLKTSRESSVSSVFASIDFPADIVKTGNLRKLKKLKRKFFILRRSCGNSSSRLEYYPSEKKWKSGCEPKRSIILKSCFNISRRLHPKHKYVICLYDHYESFSILLDSEEELDEWLSPLLELYLNDVEADDMLRSRPSYDQVWPVIVDDRELEFSKDLNGSYCLGLTAKSLSLVKTGTENFESIDFPLMSIRRCGHSGKHFFIELGRSAITGAGGVWMETEGTIVAQNMHETILSAMKSSRNREDLGPHTRPRSASTSENSKPIATRRPVGVVLPQQLPPLNSTLTTSRERCDTLPPRARTISENIQDSGYSTVSGVATANGSAHFRESSRPHSLHAWPSTNSPILSGMSYNPSSLSASLYSNSSLMSFDEADGFQETNYSWHPQATSHEDSVSSDIPSSSEKPNEYLMMSPTDDNMNIVHQRSDYLNMNPTTSQRPNSLEDKANCESIGSSPRSLGLVDYMDMRSPSSSNPESYIPMSIIGSLNADDYLGKKLSISSSSDHQSVEKLPTKDGYVPMAPGGASEDFPVPMQDGYLSMSPISSSLPKHYVEGTFFPDNNGSSISMFGSNPAEFKLDKVPSLLKHTDDESDDFIKPVRAYSIGSRSQIYECRTRAYSMGSERGKSDFKSSIESKTCGQREMNVSAKSSSAPLLQHSAPKKSSFTLGDDSGYDLMEIDYMKQSEQMHSDQKESGDISKKNMSRNWQRSSNRSSCAASPLLSLHEISEKSVSETYSKGDNPGDESGMKQPQVDCAVSPKVQEKISSTADANASDYVEMSRNNENMVVHSSGSGTVKPTTKASSVEKLDEKIIRESSEKCGKIPNVQTQNSSKKKSEKSSIIPNEVASTLKCSVQDSKEFGEYVKVPNSVALGTDVGKTTSKNADRQISSSAVGNSLETRSAGNASTYAMNKNSDNILSLKDNQPVNRLKVREASVGRGDYVNLMLGKQPEVSPPSIPRSGNIEPPKKTVESLAIPPQSERSYMNIKLGKPFTPLPNPALVSSNAHSAITSEAYRLESCAVNVGATVPRASDGSHHSQVNAAVASSASIKGATSSRNRGFCFQSIPVMRKQMSAPAGPSSLQSEVVSPVRKSSCPVTATTGMMRSNACSVKSCSLSAAGAAGLINILKGSSSSSLDNCMHREKVSLNCSSGAISKSQASSSLNTDYDDQQESQYENVNLPLSGSSSSRPSSVSSEKELNYASLDLAPASGGEVPHSPCTLKLSHPQPINEEPLTYAEIDFTKSEGLRHTAGAVQEGRL